MIAGNEQIDPFQPLIVQMNRVVIIGNAGGGKTMLSKRLSKATDLPVVYLDKVLWRPGWQALPPEDFERVHAELIARDSWIIEGVGYDETIEPRFRAADAIIFLDFPLIRHYWWAAKRQIMCIFREREDWVDGCPMLPKTLYIARIIRAIHEETRPHILKLLRTYGRERSVFHIRAVAELNQFIEAHC
jgi:adenylate kinase family enzyme